MSQFEITSLVVSGITVVILLATVVLYYLQLKTMQGQLEAAQRAAMSQNLMNLVNYLQVESVREARTFSIRFLKAKELANWTDDDKKVASLVCSTYDVAGIIVRLGGVPAESITENWGPSIRLCYEALLPWVAEMRKPENAGPTYWDDFEWLYGQTRATQAVDLLVGP